MCLAVPAQIEKLLSPERALVNMQGIRKEISIELLPGLAEGDYVIVHVGYALSKIDEAEAQRTLNWLEELNEISPGV